MNITLRNLLGGLLGGSAGILAGFYIAPWTIVVFATIGVIVGWWNQDLPRLVSNAYAQAYAEYATIKAAVYGWHAAHPMNAPMVVARVFTFVYFLATVTAWPLATLAYPSLLAYGVEPGAGVLFGAVFGIGGVTTYHFWSSYHHKEQTVRLAKLGYRQWEIQSRFGTVGLLGYLLYQYVRFGIGFSLFLVITIPFCVLLMLAGMAATAGLAFPVFASVRMGYLILSRNEHTRCLIVTLLTTGLSWFIFHEMFIDSRIVWVVALITGLVSGGATELTRMALPFLSHNTKTGKHLLVWWRRGHVAGRLRKGLLDNMLSKDDGAVWILTDPSVFWFKQSRVARVFRSVCLGIPATKPATII